MSIQQNYGNIKPSLNLDFANTKQLDPRITYSRASTGTYYDGKTVAKAEENLLLQSQSFDNSYWSTIAGGYPTLNISVTANNILAPDGTTTGDTVIGNNTTSVKQIGKGYAFAPKVLSGPHTFSIYLKYINHQYVNIMVGNAAGPATDRTGFTLDVQSGIQTAENFGADISNISVVAAPNGWYRCAFTFTRAATDANIIISLVPTATGNSYGVSGTSSSTTADASVGVWGAQLEQRSFATAYTPTTTAPITNYIPVLQTASAGTPRFDHNPITGESLGLLIEEQRTNLVTFSEQFDNAYWTKTNLAITANATVAPDGAVVADTLTRTTTTTTESMLRVPTTQAVSKAFTLSVYAKVGSAATLLYMRNLAVDTTTTTGLVKFNLATGVIDLALGSTYTGNASMTSVGNGWYRCVITGTTPATIANNLIDIGGTSSGNLGGTAGDFLYIWGAQLEAGAFATSYIPTVASQVTRAADSASMTGTNFSSWFNQSEGSFYTEAIAAALSSTAGNPGTFVGISDGTVSNRLRLKSENGTAWEGAVAGTSQFAIGTYGSAGVSYKLAGAYKVNDFAYSFNGTTAATDTSGTVPVVSQMQIGNLITAREFSGTIKKLAYYPRRLTNTQLQALTT